MGAVHIGMSSLADLDSGRYLQVQAGLSTIQIRPNVKWPCE